MDEELKKIVEAEHQAIRDEGKIPGPDIIKRLEGYPDLASLAQARADEKRAEQIKLMQEALEKSGEK